LSASAVLALIMVKIRSVRYLSDGRVPLVLPPLCFFYIDIDGSGDRGFSLEHDHETAAIQDLRMWIVRQRAR
jgi:hypothetical protein